MYPSHTKPENALKRADELLAVNEKGQALQVLHDVITARRRAWTDTLEKIMLRYISLCVELRKGKLAKDGLHQYKMTCHQQYINSLETVVKHFLQEAEERAKVAQSKADKLLIDIEDLDAEESAESIMLSSVSGEDAKERTDREVVTPWLKSLWETYRTILEILRNNSKLEFLYQSTALQAFGFCKKYNRKTEFRRLCDILRNHLATLQKYQNQAGAINLNNPESLQAHLETRFFQLDIATSLELWQEAFRSVEDIHNLINMAKKPPQPQMMANYYLKLSQIFWVSESYLFHAYAWYKYYNLVRTNKTISPEEMKLHASSVLLAALSVPIPNRKEDESIFEFDVQTEKNTRMASLLGFSVSPKREVLLAELHAKGVTSLVIPELQDLYELIEEKFQPLEICTAIKPKLDFIESQSGFKQYRKPIEKLVFIRFIQQLSRVYQAMTLDQIRKSVPFLDSHEIEQHLVEVVKNKHVEIRIDHRNGSLLFGSQSLESDRMRNQLALLAENLHNAVQMIKPVNPEEEKNKKAAMVRKITQGMQLEHRRILARKAIIEKRKERQEMLEKLKMKEEEEENQKRLKAREESEVARIQEQAKRREDSRLQQEKEKQKELSKVQAAEEQDKRMKEREKLDKKMTKAAKKLDHLERAKRQEELPLLKKHQDELTLKDREFMEKQMQETLEQHKVLYAVQVNEKKRLARMSEDREAFEKIIEDQRKAAYTVAKKAQDERLKEVREKIAQRKEQRRLEAEARKAEMELKKKQEEEEKKRKAEEAERRRAEEEKLKSEQEKQKLADAEVQKRREREMTEKPKEETKKLGWREREEEKRKEKQREEKGWGDRAEDKEKSGGWRDREDRGAREEKAAGWKDRAPEDRGAREEKGAGWRDRAPEDRGAREEKGAGWRDRAPEDRGAREEKGAGWRDRAPEDRGAREEKGAGWRDRAPEDRGAREEKGASWRDRVPQDRGAKDRAPEDRGMREEKGGWRDRVPEDRGARDRAPEDRGMREEKGGWRDRAPEDRGAREEKGGWRDRAPEDRGAREEKGGWRDRAPEDRGARDRAPEDREKNEDRGAREEKERSWRDRAPEDRGPKDRAPEDRGVREEKGGWRDRAERPKEEKGGWRDNKAPAERDAGGWRKDKQDEPKGSWRDKQPAREAQRPREEERVPEKRKEEERERPSEPREAKAPPKREEPKPQPKAAPPKKEEKEEEKEEEEDDGFTVVKKGTRKTKK